MDRLKVLDLFSGIGGFSLGLERAGMETVAFCEIDKYCQKVLSKNFPNKKIFTDIKALTKEETNELGRIDIVCGGFPCQPFSIAGQKKGKQDDRDLWPEMFRVIQAVRPTWVIGENVANFVNMEFTRTKIDLESIGYKVQPFIIPACAVGAQHRRDRVWIIAHFGGERRREGASESLQSEVEEVMREKYSYDELQESSSDVDSNGVRQQSKLEFERINQGVSKYDGKKELTPNINDNRLNREANASTEKNYKRIWQNNGWAEAASDFGYWWADQSGVGRAIHGFSIGVVRNRRERIKALGNAVVPLIPEIIGRAIIEVSNG